jgi:hypothetical protein
VRVLIQVILVVIVSYIIVPLNPKAINVAFFGINTFIGAICFQGVLQMICLLTDDLGIAYALLFLVLGLGFLFGGFLVQFASLKPYFRWFYYIAVPSMTSRANVMNELYCCNYHITCAQWLSAQDTSTTGSSSLQCPTNISSSQNDPGNLGKLFLTLLGFVDNITLIVTELIVGVFLFRMIAIMILYFRESTKKDLVERDSEKYRQELFNVFNRM